MIAVTRIGGVVLLALAVCVVPSLDGRLAPRLLRPQQGVRGRGRSASLRGQSP